MISEERKEYQKKYKQSDKYKEYQKKKIIKEVTENGNNKS